MRKRGTKPLETLSRKGDVFKINTKRVLNINERAVSLVEIHGAVGWDLLEQPYKWGCIDCLVFDHLGRIHLLSGGDLSAVGAGLAPRHSLPGDGFGSDCVVVEWRKLPPGAMELLILGLIRIQSR